MQKTPNAAPFSLAVTENPYTLDHSVNKLCSVGAQVLALHLQRSPRCSTLLSDTIACIVKAQRSWGLP